jgi:phosphoribosylformylglycinamidine cyclo-ligase
MPGFYPKAELELVGFGVGVVERDKVIDGSSIANGDVLVGLASNGLHSNGFSLVRSVLDAGVAAGKFDLRDAPPDLNQSIAAALLAPTRIYVKPILNLLRDFEIHGMAHITGGGFEGNVPRILPKGVRARIDPSAWPRPRIFDFLARHGEIPEQEMRRVQLRHRHGPGRGTASRRKTCCSTRGMGERAYRIGVVERKPDDAEPLLFEDATARGLMAHAAEEREPACAALGRTRARLGALWPRCGRAARARWAARVRRGGGRGGAPAELPARALLPARAGR